MNKDEIFLIIFLYSLIILIGSARSVLVPILNNKRTTPVISTRSLTLVKSPKKLHNHSVIQKNPADLDATIFHDPVSVAQKTSIISRSSHG